MFLSVTIFVESELLQIPVLKLPVCDSFSNLSFKHTELWQYTASFTVSFRKIMCLPCCQTVHCSQRYHAFVQIALLQPGLSRKIVVDLVSDIFLLKTWS